MENSTEFKKNRLSFTSANRMNLQYAHSHAPSSLNASKILDSSQKFLLKKKFVLGKVRFEYITESVLQHGDTFFSLNLTMK